jgi:tetratricopeptide (TPR) repeat protein
MQRNIDHVTSSLIKAKQRGKGAILLTGAGCSVTAGIPLAQGFVDIIQREYLPAYKSAKKKNYSHCMSELSSGDRRDLISRYVDNAEVNWAHVCIASLMRAGYVSRVLTTNFDPLLERAAALQGIYPAVYDCATSAEFKKEYISDPSIFHLHGQRVGFVLLNTPTEFDQYYKRLTPVLEQVGRDRPCIVIGYSGETDPVFRHLSNIEQFDFGLYWVLYREQDPPRHVRENILTKGKDGYHVTGYSADDFFLILAQRLECFPPDFVVRPFSYLKTALRQISSFRFPDLDGGINLLDRAGQCVDYAIGAMEETQGDTCVTQPPSRLLQIERELLSGKYKLIIDAYSEGRLASDRDTLRCVALAYIQEAFQLLDDWDNLTWTEKPDAITRAELFLGKAAELRPDLPEIWNGWGMLLCEKADGIAKKQAQKLYKDAINMFEKALRMAPDAHAVRSNLARALGFCAELSPEPAARDYFARSNQNFAQAHTANPKNTQTLYSWGTMLIRQANRQKSSEQRRLLYNKAASTLQTALTVSGDLPLVHVALGNLFLTHAESTPGTKAVGQLDEAIKSFSGAIEIRPNFAEAMADLGYALWLKADRNPLNKASASLRERAKETLLEAEELKEGVAAYNLACWATLEGDFDKAFEWLDILERQGRLRPDELAEDPDLTELQGDSRFVQLLSRLKKKSGAPAQARGKKRETSQTG